MRAHRADAHPHSHASSLQIRCWDVQQNGQAIPKAAQSHQAPLLCSAWHSDGSKVFSAGCDNQAKMWDLGSNAMQQVASHDAPIRKMVFISELNMLVTGGWDRTLRYWDLRQPNPAHVHQLPERCYAMSLNYPLLVVGTAERKIEVCAESMRKEDRGLHTHVSAHVHTPSLTDPTRPAFRSNRSSTFRARRSRCTRSSTRRSSTRRGALLRSRTVRATSSGRSKDASPFITWRTTIANPTSHSSATVSRCRAIHYHQICAGGCTMPSRAALIGRLTSRIFSCDIALPFASRIAHNQRAVFFPRRGGWQPHLQRE